MSINVTVKWGRKKLEDVPVDLEADASAFLATIEGLTAVPPAKQKLLCKKAWSGSLKPGMALSSTKLTDGATVTLIGTAAKLAKASSTPVSFVEDMPKSAMASVGAALPPGLLNGMNNTCYLNATLQALRAVPELDKAVRGATAADASSSASSSLIATSDPSAAAIARALGALFTEMSRKTDEDKIFPSDLLAAVRGAHPIFAERAPNGIPRQQDSEEFQSTLLMDLATTLTSPVPGAVDELAPALEASGRKPNVIDTLFGVELETTLTPKEAEAVASSSSSVDTPTVRKETQLKLVCNIQGGGGSTVKVNHLSEGLRLALEGTVERRSEALGRDALWARRSRVARLPKYLCVQFMRFYWMTASDPKPGEPAGRKMKIKRAVAFPVNGFDIMDYCTPDVQSVLVGNRDKHAREEDAKRAAREAADSATDAKRAKATAEKAEDTDEELAAALKASMASGSAASSASSSSDASAAAATTASIGWGLPKEFEGLYELLALVSHAGPDADSGHYMGWVRQGTGSDNWLNFDDETVSPCRTEHITDLKGSSSDRGDIAYMAIYRAVK